MWITLFVCITFAIICFLLLRRQKIQCKRDRETIISLENQLRSADARIKNLILENQQSPDVLYDKNGAAYKKINLESGAILYIKTDISVNFDEDYKFLTPEEVVDSILEL